MASGKPKEQALELLALGLNKQQVFDQLRLEHPKQRPGKLARLLRYMATRHAQERYRDLQRLLLACIVLSVVLRLWRSVGGSELHWEDAHRWFSLVPLASIGLAWGVYHWHGQHFGWVGWMNLLGAMSLLGGLGRLADGAPFTWSLGSDVLSAVIGGLALYLFIKVFPEHKTEKDPMTGEKRYVFPEGRADMPMH
jgi:hypothetical protein